MLAQNVLRATSACTFSTSQLPKVIQTWGVLYIFTSKCASRHNGVHFFHISTSKSRPRPMFCNCLLPNVLRATACNFSLLICPDVSAPAALASLLWPSGATKLEKQSVSRLPYLFAHLHLVSSDFLHLLSSPFWLSPRPSFFLALLFLGRAFHLSILSEVSLLNFLRSIFTRTVNEWEWMTETNRDRYMET